ncbi:tRNA (guanine-N(7)-)-methyltransferase [Aquicella lusitana]|uniref:tRNA (guanine-N(7)-)-methyltransferase n=2 Tax=Aquicella lusitana TaxID=254246 RepID=A0A370G7X0_9COXI|nr:tRNA (guanine-N(7)-)-methyltransferase [Aquicella lusitana]VVC74065.1 tRNA (guanine-N(7)-)-methyltransferase [Aquicella lusitana]
MAHTMISTPPKHFRVRSFVGRNSRITAAQEQAFYECLPLYGLSTESGLLDYDAVFGREAPRFLEIGFGSGHSLLALAKSCPEQDFIGIETHKPGVGALFQGIRQHALTNLRVYHADAVDVLDQCIPDASLEGIQIFFPDPWQKRRHHPRRLIQPELVKKLAAKLKPAGTLHLATDWEDYAIQMMQVLSEEEALFNLAGMHQFAPRSPYRPLVTKFERRALREGRHVRELHFAKR